MLDDKPVTAAEIKELASSVAAEKDPRRQSELASKLLKASQALRESHGA
ncbi:MAG: hypothetical protein ACYDCQ_01865 [Dehalococcoidia bacterium]